MKTLIAAVFAVLMCTPTLAERLDLQSGTKEEVCHVWTKNAMYGASQRYRGLQEFKVVYLTSEQVMALIADDKVTGAEALFVFDDRFAESEKRWIEDGMFAGWSRLDAALRVNPNIEPDAYADAKALRDGCMDGTAL